MTESPTVTAPETPQASSSLPEVEKASGLERVERAFMRAEERLTGKKDTGAGAGAGEQATEGAQPAGVSAPDTAAAASAAGKPEPAAGTGASPAPQAAVPPDDWSEQDRAAFETLPGDEARKLVLSQYQRMQGAFTQAMQHVADLRAVGEAMTRLGATREEILDVLETARAFGADPKGTLAKLAESKRIPVWFDRPGPEDEPPEDALRDPKAFAKWVSERAAAAARQEREQAMREAETAREADAVRAALREQFVTLAREHPDFPQHRERVVEAMAANQGRKTPEDAYRLATYEALAKLAREGEATKKELAAARAELEKLQAGRTRPPPGASTGKVDPREAAMDPIERAFRRAERKLAAARQ